MRIAFTGTTNDDFIWVNSITFQLKDGNVVSIDRNRTEYIVADGEYEMIWNACYALNGRKHDYGLSWKMFEDAKILHVDISDAAPENYGFDISFWKVFDS